ncbi:MAG: acyltransferase family protein [Limnobaculum xujianqingii]|uniref:acyltransferase family protein n=1 Tax=Kluyvera sp. TaxID=1538228 RepID=UPI003A875E13
MTSHKKNSFDIARHIAALMVIFSHHHALSGLPEPIFLGFETYGGLAVLIFFSISGFLISKSAMRSDDFISFTAKRIRRIFPALIGCAIVINILLGSIYFPDASFIHYLSRAVKTISLNGFNVFITSKDFTHTDLLNGSLWTLPLEVACYMIAGCIIIFSKKPQYFVAVLLIILFGAIYTLSFNVNIQILSIPVNLFFTRALAFFIGSVMAIYYEKWNKINIKLFFNIIFSILHVWN